MTTQQIKSMIAGTAQARGVDPQLALAVAQTESSFNPAARSIKGAAGLFQLMPATARAYGVTDPYDPAQNTAAGVAMLADLQRQYSGDTVAMLAAYNWGSGNLASGAPLPTETQNYITRIFKLLGLPLSSDSVNPRKAPRPIRQAAAPKSTTDLPPAA